MTLKNNRDPLLCSVKLHAWIHNHQSISTWDIIRKRCENSKIDIFRSSCDLEISRMTLKNNRDHLGCYVKLYAWFHNHQFIPTWDIIRKRPENTKIDIFRSRCDLEIWRMTLKNNRDPLLCSVKLYASFHNHRFIPIRDIIRKRSENAEINCFWATRGPIICRFACKWIGFLRLPICMVM